MTRAQRAAICTVTFSAQLLALAIMIVATAEAFQAAMFMLEDRRNQIV